MQIVKLLPLLTAAALLMLFPAPSAHPEVSLGFSALKPEARLKLPRMAPTTHLEFAPFHYKPMGTYKNPFPSSQCTAGAASMKGNVTWRGNANRWDDNARAQGRTVSPVPIVGAIAQSDRGSAGHVAVVVGVRPGQVQVTERNYDYHGSVRTTWVATSRYVYIYL